jgi:prepilin-type N-terminal cleavage/methylation domain-containing protein
MNTKNLLTRGFTLIELLVVIAIIGILAAVVIGSLNDARSGGQNASIQQTMTNLRSQAELYYNGAGNFSYTDLCSASAPTANGITAALAVVNGPAYVAADDEGTVATNDAADEANRKAQCNSNASAYQVTVPLAGGAGYWCVDSTGFSGDLLEAAKPAAGDMACN